MTKILIDSLTKRFGEFVALDGIDLSISQGEFIGLLGPSGCGKTTTLNVLAGFETPTSGRVLLDNKDLTQIPANRRGMGIVFQSYALFPHLNVNENVAFGLRMRKVARPERETRVRKALDLVRMSSFGDRYPKALSGGQQQRVAIARALAIDPELLLLDEPLSNLDAKLREEMQIEIRSIQRRVGTTTIMVTHDQAEALATCDRIAVMNAGKIVQCSTPQDLYDDPKTSFAAKFVGRSTQFTGTVQGSTDAHSEVIVHDTQICLKGAPTTLPAGTSVRLAIRPEKIDVVAPAEGIISGRVVYRVFQGHAWLFFVETAVGTVSVSDLNRGGSVYSEGQDVGLRWPPSATSIITEPSL